MFVNEEISDFELWKEMEVDFQRTSAENLDKSRKMKANLRDRLVGVDFDLERERLNLRELCYWIRQVACRNFNDILFSSSYRRATRLGLDGLDELEIYDEYYGITISLSRKTLSSLLQIFFDLCREKHPYVYQGKELTSKRDIWVSAFTLRTIFLTLISELQEKEKVQVWRSFLKS